MSTVPTEHQERNDPYHLDRFVQAQAINYDQALLELQQGQKRSHWMWYIFPQYDGLGYSSTSKLYTIKSLAEAKAYLKHAVLGERLTHCAEVVLGV